MKEPHSNSVGGPRAEVTGVDVSRAAFAVLGNETRLGVLVALWEAKVPGEPHADTALSFSELRDRVGARDSGGFNYHLEKLVGRYVDRTDDGYVLRYTGERLVRALIAGTPASEVSFHDVSVDDHCPECGEGIRLDYEDEMLVVRCSNCKGYYRFGDYPTGVLSANYLPPVAFRNRTPEEVYRAAPAWFIRQWRSMIEGVCPSCSGTVSATVVRCVGHDTEDGICDHCGSGFEFRVLRVCEICKNDMWSPAYSAVFSDSSVVGFFYDHGLDPFGRDHPGKADVIQGQRLVSDDPLRIAVEIALDDDSLTAILDETGTVVDVTET